MYDAKSLQRSPDRLVAPTLFVDGHAQRRDFTTNFLKNPRRGLEPGPDWMWYKPLP
jgi:prepilin-type processing-associated H-X9-DG protein